MLSITIRVYILPLPIKIEKYMLNVIYKKIYNFSKIKKWSQISKQRVKNKLMEMKVVQNTSGETMFIDSMRYSLK